MIVIPAIDVRAGRAVRLLRGDPNEETTYDDDPVEVAVRFQEEGARRLHVVDLDAALDEGANRDTIRDICRSVVLPVQVGGGVRTLEDVAAVLEIGAGRAILGTSAALDPGFVARAVEEFAERILVAVDVRGGHAMVKGWREEGPPVEEAIPALERFQQRALRAPAALAQEPRSHRPQLGRRHIRHRALVQHVLP